MKFGNLIRSALALTALIGAASQAEPLYFFGNAPTANGSYPQGCPASVTNCAPLASSGLFTEAVAVTQTANFESSSTGLIGATSVPVLGGTLSQSTPPSSLQGGSIMSGATASGRFNTTNGASSGRWFESDHSFTIELATDVGAFGFYGTDFNDFAGTLQIELLNDDVRVYENVFTNANGGALPLRSTTTTTAQDGSLIFFGFGSELLFDRIVFKIGQSPNTPIGDWDYLGFDDIMVGNLGTTTPPPNPAPEPGSLALVGLALFAAGWARKAQRRA